MAPSVVMIDLDMETFKTQRAFAMALTKTLKKIARQLNSQPTVIWSGRGYHIYLVLEAFVLEAEDAFNNRRFGQQPLQKFLRFEEWYLSNGRCDPQHNKTVSSRNCMLRIPGFINSKNGQVVRIEQRWNGYRPNIKFLLEDFYVYLSSERIAELEEKRRKKFRGEFGRVSGSCIPSHYPLDRETSPFSHPGLSKVLSLEGPSTLSNKCEKDLRRRGCQYY